MMQSMSIRAKLTLMTSVLVAAISLFIYVYFPGEFEKRAMEATVEKARTVATMTAFGAVPLLMFDDVVKKCEACYRNQPAPSRSRITGMRAESFGDLLFIDHGEVRLRCLTIERK